MCIQCDGFDHDELIAHYAEIIAAHRFMVTGVEGTNEPGTRGWAYTVGLDHHADHPELIVAGPEFAASGPWLNELGRRVLAGERFADGDVVATSRGAARFGAVHDIQFRLGTFNVWLALVDAGIVRNSGFRALQVFAPAAWFCAEHTGLQPVLAHQHERVDLVFRPNRAIRRARGWS